jgi:hypothetical protein
MSENGSDIIALAVGVILPVVIVVAILVTL